MTPKPKSAFLTVRVPANMHMKFHIKAQRYGQPSAVLREIIEAFLDDRLSILPPSNRKESLYVARKQD